MMNIHSLQFGATAKKVTYTKDSGTVCVDLDSYGPEAARFSKAGGFTSFLSTDARVYGGPEHDFGSANLGNGFRKPETVAELIESARLIAELEIDPKVLEGTGLKPDGVKHHLLTGLARILCADSVGFCEQLQQMKDKAKGHLTL